jgi:hypothetical protein
VELSSFCFSSLVVAMKMVWWDIENVPPPTYALLEHSYVLLEHTLAFHCKENLGLLSVQMLVWVLVYRYLEVLTKAIYIPITELGICIQHCCCTSSSFGKKKLHLEYIVSFDGSRVSSRVKSRQIPSSSNLFCLIGSCLIGLITTNFEALAWNQPCLESFIEVLEWSCVMVLC